MGSGQRLDTISKRNHASAREIEALFWRAMLDSPDAAKEYMAKDCVMINPLFHPSGDASPMTQATEPAIDEILDGVGEGGWTSYRMHGTPEVVEIDLMAVSVLYKISLYRETGESSGKKAGKKEIEEVQGTVSSCWRQVAGGDWVLVSQHCA
jgi:ketosteroid isomerase-like protein